jgi:hypothetical protein
MVLSIVAWSWCEACFLRLDCFTRCECRPKRTLISLGALTSKTEPGTFYLSDPYRDTVKVQLFLAVLRPWSPVATISTVWVPVESMPVGR